ncbi:acyl-coenzyme A thioesterase 1-like isoform X2 [Macrobrachium rosenbergii]|uniref:acyl-coenzyme A thioesterase 1-like isoform X2 n=1 Tax=Macrobrachium rosenbergii TaxID=79674 RepID=UPI0034D6709A
MSSTSQDGVMLSVNPLSCLHDEPVSIKVSGLKPGQDVTLHSSMKDVRNVHFMSYAHYRADGNGEVDVDVMESLGGEYEGVFPMGLFGSLAPAPNEYKYTRFFKRDVENPNIVTISVHDGHLSAETLCSPEASKPLSSVVNERHYMAPGVQRIPVRYGKVRGSLFLPPGDGPFPGVVDMFGTAGGLLEFRSAQLASRGFASLALAFFNYDDLPKGLEEFDIAYFEEAVEYLLKHEKVINQSVGVIGISKGGDLALSMATYIPEVKAAVAINGCNANVQAEFKLSSRIIPGLQFDVSRAKFENEILDCFDVLDDSLSMPEAIIPVEEADANFLFLVGRDDRNWKSVEYADHAVNRLIRAGKSNFEECIYNDAGHLIEPPYSPFSRASYHGLLSSPNMWGGQTQPHCEAQVQAWQRVTNFLFKTLVCPRGKL